MTVSGEANDDGGEANDAAPFRTTPGIGAPAARRRYGKCPDAGEDAWTAGLAPDAGLVDGGISGFAGLVISQVFGGGGNSGAPLQSDFVELFNRSSAPLPPRWPRAPVRVEGVGSFGAPLSDGGPSGNIFALLVCDARPGRAVYYLVALDSNAAVGAPLPTPDATGGLKLSSTDGKVALTTDASPLGCGAANARCPQTYIVDLVGYGAAADFEGSAAAGTLSNTKAALRLGNGCIDTRNNAADFAVGTPAPRNSATPRVDCSAPQGGTDGGPGVDAGGDAGSPQSGDGGASANDDAGGPPVGPDAGGGSTSDDAGAGAENDSGRPTRRRTAAPRTAERARAAGARAAPAARPERTRAAEAPWRRSAGSLSSAARSRRAAARARLRPLGARSPPARRSPRRP